MAQHCYHKCWLNLSRVERRDVDRYPLLSNMDLGQVHANAADLNVLTGAYFLWLISVLWILLMIYIVAVCHIWFPFFVLHSFFLCFTVTSLSQVLGRVWRQKTSSTPPQSVYACPKSYNSVVDVCWCVIYLFFFRYFVHKLGRLFSRLNCFTFLISWSLIVMRYGFAQCWRP